MKIKLKGGKKPQEGETPAPKENLRSMIGDDVPDQAEETAPPLDLNQPPLSALEQDVQNFLRLQKLIKEASDQAEKIKSNLKEYLGTSGKEDAKGHKSVHVLVDGRKHLLLLERRVSVNLAHDKALALARGKNLEYCIEVVEQIKEDALQDAYKTGAVTDEEMQSLVITKESFALKVSEVKDGEEAR